MMVALVVSAASLLLRAIGWLVVAAGLYVGLSYVGVISAFIGGMLVLAGDVLFSFAHGYWRSRVLGIIFLRRIA